MKYAINKEFGIYRKFKPPVNRLVLGMAKVFLSLMPKGMHSSESLKIQRLKITCRDGKKIKLYIITPKNKEGKLPVIFNIHGGGFVFKGAPYHYKLAREYAIRTGNTVIFVDYRLAFDSEYKTPLSDCIDAYKFVIGNAEKYNLAKDKVIFAGDSAGGYLAVALTKECVKQKLPEPVAELLVYPVADPEMTSLSMKEYTDTPMWNAENNRKMWRYYSHGNNAYNPLLDDLSFMPVTYIETADYDCLRDEGIMLHRKISACGGKSELYQTEGTVHGYDIKLKATTTIESINKRIEFLKSVF